MAITSLAMADIDGPVGSLMCVDDLRQLETRVDLVFEIWRYPEVLLSVCVYARVSLTYSDGWAGSMITASLVLSSDTR
jgi:hypothetical protein